MLNEWCERKCNQFTLQTFLRMSGSPYFILPIDERNQPDNSYRPIWLGDVNLDEAKRRAGLDSRAVGMVSMYAQVNGAKKLVFGVRVHARDAQELRPKVTLQKQDSSYIPSTFRLHSNSS